MCGSCPSDAQKYLRESNDVKGGVGCKWTAVEMRREAKAVRKETWEQNKTQTEEERPYRLTTMIGGERITRHRSKGERKEKAPMNLLPKETKGGGSY